MLKEEKNVAGGEKGKESVAGGQLLVTRKC